MLAPAGLCTCRAADQEDSSVAVARTLRLCTRYRVTHFTLIDRKGKGSRSSSNAWNFRGRCTPRWGRRDGVDGTEDAEPVLARHREGCENPSGTGKPVQFAVR